MRRSLVRKKGSFLLTIGALCVFTTVTAVILKMRVFSNSSPNADSFELLQSREETDSNQIIFAGLSGVPPKFIDSGSNKGLGWVEHQTLAIRKGMKEDGFHLKQEWMTPARISHEFRKGSPICTYPAVWSRPEQVFSKKPDQLYTMALSVEPEGKHSILYKKSNAQRFQVYIKPNGDLDIDRLLRDPKLKTLLVRDKDYGAFTGRLTERDSNGDQVVKSKYRDHISVLLIRDNRQLVEMLNADRFDYIFSDSIESQDFEVAGIDRKIFEEKNYETFLISDIKDPRLRQVSIACSIHPLTLKAIPYFNKWIKLDRNLMSTVRKANYRMKLEKSSDGNFYDPTILSAEQKLLPQIADGSLDHWIPKQAKHFPALSLPPAASSEKAPLIPKKSSRPPLFWRALYEKNQSVLVLNDSQFYHRSDLESDFEEKTRTVSGNMPIWPWDHTLLTQILPEWLSESLMSFQFSNIPPLFRALSEVKLSQGFASLTLFASGTTGEQVREFLQANELSGLKELTIFDAGSESSKAILRALPKSLLLLNFTHSALSESRPQDFIPQLKDLRDLRLDSTQIKAEDLGELVERLPENLASLSIGFQSPSWGIQNAKKFASRKWPHLKRLSLPHDNLGEEAVQFILKAIPQTATELNLRGNSLTDRSVRLLLSRFTQLKSLNLTSNFLHSLRPYAFPASLQELRFYSNSLSVDPARLPSSLSQLTVGSQAGEGEVTNIPALLSRLRGKVSILSLSNTQLDAASLRTLVENDSIHNIEYLDLSRNSLTDDALELLSKARFSVSFLNLEDNLIQNRGAQILAERFLPSLKGLNIAQNPIGETGITAIIEKLPRQLRNLNLGSLAVLDVSFLAKHLPSGLRNLNLSGNQITNREIEVLAKNLPPYLYELDLEGSLFDASGAFSLATQLPPYLSSLNLRAIPLGDIGLRSIARELPQALTELKLSEIEPTLETAKALAANMPPYLRRLEIENSKWAPESAEAVLQAIPSSLQRLRFIGVPLGGLRGAKALSTTWPNNLREFDLMGSDLGDPGVIQLSKTLPNTIELLQFQGVGMGDPGLMALASRDLEHVNNLNIGQGSFTEKGMLALSSKPRHLSVFEMISSRLKDRGVRAMNANLMDSVRAFHVVNQPWSNDATVEFIGKMHPETSYISFSSQYFTHLGVDRFIAKLPENTSILVIRGSGIGEIGYQKLEAEKERRKKLGRLLVLGK